MLMLSAALLAFGVACNSREGDSSASSAYGELAGGDATVFATDGGAYSLPIPGIDAATLADHNAGAMLFSTTFQPAGAGGSEGRGPLFVHASCDSCHFRAGRSFAGPGLLG